MVLMMGDWITVGLMIVSGWWTIIVGGLGWWGMVVGVGGLG